MYPARIRHSRFLLSVYYLGVLTVTLAATSCATRSPTSDSTPATPAPQSENLVIRKVSVVKTAQPFVVSYRQKLGDTSGNWEPVLENRTPQPPWVFLVLECNVQFPGKEKKFDLKNNFVLIDASGNRHIAHQYLSGWAPGEGFANGWSVQKEKKGPAELKLMFPMEEGKLKQLRLLFSGKECEVDLANHD